MVGESAQSDAGSLSDGEVGMVENVRYEPGEESKDDTACGAGRSSVMQPREEGIRLRRFRRRALQAASVYDIALRLLSAGQVSWSRQR